eukprot:4144783-Amphidinium_carterae.1
MTKSVGFETLLLRMWGSCRNSWNKRQSQCCISHEGGDNTAKTRSQELSYRRKSRTRYSAQRSIVIIKRPDIRVMLDIAPKSPSTLCVRRCFLGLDFGVPCDNTS